MAAHIDEKKLATPSAMNSQMVPHSFVWRGYSPTSLLSLTCTILSLMLETLVTEFAFLPAYYILFNLYFDRGIPALLLAAGPVLFLDQLITLTVMIGLKWIVIGRRQEGNYPVFGLYYWKWRFVHVVEHYVEEHVSSHMTDTAAYNVFLNCLGAKIHPSARINFAHIGDVDLITVDAQARIEREATLCPSRIWRGELQLRSIHIGVGARVAHRSFAAGGCQVPHRMELAALSSADPMGAHHLIPRRDGGAHSDEDEKELSRLQMRVGAPMLMAVEAAAFAPTVLFLIGLWDLMVKSLHAEEQNLHRQAIRFFTGFQRGYNLAELQQVLYPFCACLPWVMTFVHGGSHFLVVALVKQLLVGKFVEGRPQTSWERFQRWVVERMTTANTFIQFMELWVNTEVLSCLYRLLGVRVAFRVNMDVFGAVEYDLITIERDVVFGSAVLLVNSSSGVARHITLKRSSCVLDHSVLLSGTSLPEGALLGSCTIAAEDQKLEAMTVYTGSVRGASVRLFQRPLLPGERIEGDRVVQVDLPEQSQVTLAPAAARQRALEKQALDCHNSCFWFNLFNLWCVLSAFLFAPLPDLVYWATIILDFQVYDYFKDSDNGEVVSVLLLAPLHVLVSLTMLLVMVLLKWILIGRWTAGDRPYYTWFHFKWASLMVAFSSLDDISEAIAGTWLAVAFIRIMGGRVGKRVCFFGHGFEYDLLNIGDDVCIGDNCDVTAHTVENMVMKMDEVRFERGASLLNGSIVMPGAVMEAGSSLIDHSQVLKGDSVPEGCVFGGLPAKLLTDYAGFTSEPLRRPRGWSRSVVGDDTMLLSATSSSLGTELAANSLVELPRLRSSQGREVAEDSHLESFVEIFSDSEAPSRRRTWFGRLMSLVR